MKTLCRWALFALASMAVAAPVPLYAQLAPACTMTVSYSPFNPVVGQAVTLTATVQTSVPLTGTNFFSGMLSFYAYPASGAGSPFSQQDYDSTPGTVTATVTPDNWGNWRFYAEFDPSYSYGGTNVCSGPLEGQMAMISVAPSSPVSEVGSLKGQYTFLMQGAAPGSPALSNKFAVIGSFTADGNGNITAGMEDENSAAGANTALPLTGSYTLDSTGHGTLTLKTSLGVEDASFFVPVAQLGAPYISVQSASLVSTGAGVASNGYLTSSTAPAMPDPSSFYLSVHGDSACNNGCNGGSSVTSTGLLTFAGGTSKADLINAAPSYALPEKTTTGTVSAVDPVTGRFLYTLTDATSSGQTPTSFVGYVLKSGSSFYTMSLNPHTYYYLLSGTGSSQ